MDICYRPITSEFAELANLHGQCFAKSWKAATFREMFEESAQYSGRFILDGSAPIGFVICSQTLDEAEIITICILPHYRGQALGAALLTQQLEILQKNSISKIFLEVNEHNHAAIKLYTGLGFNQTALRKKYYKLADGQFANALLLSKNI